MDGELHLQYSQTPPSPRKINFTLPCVYIKMFRVYRSPKSTQKERMDNTRSLYDTPPPYFLVLFLVEDYCHCLRIMSPSKVGVLVLRKAVSGSWRLSGDLTTSTFLDGSGDQSGGKVKHLFVSFWVSSIPKDHECVRPDKTRVWSVRDFSGQGNYGKVDGR